MLTVMAGMSIEDGLVMLIHPGSFRNYNDWLFRTYGRDKGADIPTATGCVAALRPLLNKHGNDPRLSIIVFTLDETTCSRELAPLAGHYPALKLGPAWWFHDSPEGMRRVREQVTETAASTTLLGSTAPIRRWPISGLRADMPYVHEAIADYALTPLIERLMRDEAATSLAPAPEQDLAAYAAWLVARFANTALNRKLRQIAMDGSQKIPQRWLETLAYHQREGRQCPTILTAIAAWIGFVGQEGFKLDDPLADALYRLWQTEGAGGMPLALFGDRGLFTQHWVATPADLDLIRATMGQTA